MSFDMSGLSNQFLGGANPGALASEAAAHYGDAARSVESIAGNFGVQADPSIAPSFDIGGMDM